MYQVDCFALSGSLSSLTTVVYDCFPVTHISMLVSIYLFRLLNGASRPLWYLRCVALRQLEITHLAQNMSLLLLHYRSHVNQLNQLLAV